MLTAAVFTSQKVETAQVSPVFTRINIGMYQIHSMEYYSLRKRKWQYILQYG